MTWLKNHLRDKFLAGALAAFEKEHVIRSAK